jgi:nucleotide-binding universal stress UspA family protein
MTPTREDRRRDDLPRPGPAPRYRRVLVPLDGTPFSEAALRPAAEIAARSGGSLRLASVLTQGSGPALHVEPVTHETERPVEGMAALEDYLDEVSGRVRESWSCDVEARMLTEGEPTDALVAYAKDLEADLVVAATHTRGLIVRALVGSTATDLVREAPCPVLLVPSSDPTPGPDTPLQEAVESIVVGVDPAGDPYRIALAHARAHAELWTARLHLVQVSMQFPLPATTPSGGGPIRTDQSVQATPDALAAVQARLDELQSSLRDVGIDAHAHALTGFTAAEALADFVDEHAADLLVVGRHHRNLLERMWTGSESDRLARRVRSAGILVCPLE